MRITDKDLQAVVDRINRMAGAPAAQYTRVEDKLVANIGYYHLSYENGGVSLHRMASKSGAVSDVLACGHTNKRHLYELMHAFIRGWDAAKEKASEIK